MKIKTIWIFLLVMHMSSFSFAQDNTKKMIKIAREMRDIGSQCQYLSSEQMKKERLLFLNNNKDATIKDLIGAIETKLDDQDIISLLESFDCVVCDEYAASVKTDHGKGLRAIDRNFGDTTIERVMSWRLL